MSASRILSFSVAGRKLALPLGEIRRVAPLPLLSAPVGAPDFVTGVFILQGTPVAAVRLDRLLGLSGEPPGLYAPLLVLKHEDPALALHVGRAHAITPVAEGDLHPVADGDSLNGCLAACVSAHGETLYLLSARNILLAAERERLSALDAMRRERLEALEGGARP